MNKFLLKITALFNPLWRSLGVNTEQLLSILETKLLMDSRRVSGFGNQSNKKKKQSQQTVNLFIYFVFGIFMMTMLIRFEHFPTALTIYFAAWMVFIIMTLITDFTEVLIDVRDNFIILPQPVNDRTITVSRILHVILYLSKLMLTFTIPALIYIGIAHGFLGILVFLFQFFLSVLIAIFFVNIVYLVILNVTSISRFKEIISYFQIGFTILIFGTYYLLPRILDFEQLQDADVMDNPFTYVFPPAWLASIWGVLMEQITQPNYLILSTLAILTPIVFSLLIANVLAKEFSQKMMAITTGGSKDKKTPKKATSHQKLSFPLRFTQLFAQNTTEKAGIEWIWRMTQRSRDYKMRVYPTIAFVPLFFVYVAVQEGGTLTEKLAKLQSENWYIFLIYFCLVLFSTPFTSTQYTEKSKTAWVFHTLPITQPGSLVISAFWVTLVKYFVPTFLLMFATGFSIWGVKVLDDYFLGLAIILLTSAVIAIRLYDHLPFSESWKNQAKGGSFVRNIVMLLVVGLLGFGHYLLIDKTLWVLLAGGIGLLLFFFTLKYIRKRPLEKFE
ncbi:MAG: hypothetical protein AAF806_07605 [Bacteroidota bacterium]